MELRNEKVKFEEQMQSIIKYGGPSNNDIQRFNLELEGAFKEILDNVDQSSILMVNQLSNRQTEMFNMTTKHRLGSAFKNDCIGVWYDAKSNVTQQVAKLKVFVQEKCASIRNQSFATPPSQTDPQTKTNYSELIKKFEDDLVTLKHQTHDYSKTMHRFQ